MPGLNTTGKPKVEDYFLGRGRLYVAAINTATGKPAVTGWRDLGNIPEFNYSVENEFLEHFSSRSGLKVTDKEVLVSQKVKLTFKMDEISFDNLAIFVSGTTAVYTNAAIAGFAEHSMIVGVVLGRWYDIVNSTGQRAYDILAADLTLEKSGAPDVALVVDTDFELDLKQGRVFLKSTAVNIAAGDTLDVTLAAQAGAKAVTELRGLKATSAPVAVKFISENAANADGQQEFQFHSVSLVGEGDLGLITDEFGQLAVTGTAAKNDLADANSPFFTVRHHADM